jgi:septal ring-binding cell division protein DamX
MAAVRSVQEQLDQEESAEKENSTLKASDSSSKSSWLGWGLLLGLLVSMGVLGAVYKERIVQEVDNMKEYLEGPKWEKKSQDKPSQERGATDSNAKGTLGNDVAPSQEREAGIKEAEAKDDVAREKQPTVGMSSSTKTPIKLDDSLIPDKEAVLSAKEIKDKAKLEHKESSPPVALVSTPGLSQQPVPTKPVSTEKSDIKPPTLSAGNAPVKEEPLRIPILKDPVPLDAAKGGVREGKREMVKDESKDLAKDQLKEKEKEKIKEKSKDNSTASADKPRESMNASSASSAVPKSDLDWVNALPERSWVLQLAAMPSKADLQALKNAQPAFEGAQILFTKNPSSGKTYYILVKGPMSSKEEAQGMMTQGSALSNAWLRSAKSLKAQFKGN